MGPLSKIRARATYANVIATLALFAALGGGSFAVAALSGSEKRVVKKIAKKQANKRITARAPGLTVAHADSADAATPTGAAGGDLTGTYPNPTIDAGKVTTAKLANGAATASKLAGVNERTSTVNIGAGLGNTTTADCLDGEKLLSGGFSATGSDVQVLFSNRSGNGWSVGAFNNGASLQTLTAHAYCLAP